MTVFISGQKHFGAEVFRLCQNLGFHIAGVCAPLGDGHLRPLAARFGVPIIPGGSLTAETLPAGVDLGIAAHSFDYVGRATRYKTRLGWIGYHPSLLPRHRGRSAVEWAIRMRDPVTGGTVYWLNAGIDRGEIERQGWAWVDPKYYAMKSADAARELWRETLQPLGAKLIKEALTDIKAGKINKTPQDPRFSTFEPSLDVKDIFKPDLLMISAKSEL